MSFAAGTPTIKGKLGNVGFITVVPLTPSGNYSTGGDALSFTGLAPLGKKPKAVLVFGIAGFIYSYNVATEKLLVYVNTAGGANTALGEHTAAALVAGILADTITAVLLF